MKKVDLNKLKSVLPVSPGILGKEEYFNAAVLIPFIKLDDEYHLLFEKRAAKIRQGSEICFPGGEFEKHSDADYKQTALRETSEELGISINQIKIIGQLDVLVGPMGVTVDPFVGEIKISSLNEISIDENEVEKIFTVPVNHFIKNEPEIYHLRMEFHPSIKEKDGSIKEIFPTKSLGLPERYWKSWHMPEREVYVYKTEEGTIWGLTAMLIREITSKLKLII